MQAWAANFRKSRSVISSDQSPNLRASVVDNSTIDGFLDNSFFVSQSAKGTHRSGLDAVLLAATIREDAKGLVADFGAGCGAAGMAVAQRCPAVSVDLIEINTSCISHCHRSALLPANRHLAERLSIIEADVTLNGTDRDKAGLIKNTYDHMVANPPYNDASFQGSPNADRAFAHVMEPGMLEKWVRTAAHVGKAKSELTLIARPASIIELIEAMKGRFGSIRLVPVHPRAEADAVLLLVRGVKGGKAPLRVLPGFIVESEEGEDVMRGRTGIAL